MIYDSAIIDAFLKVGFNIKKNDITWLYGFDVGSGCVWNIKCIRKIEPVEENDIMIYNKYLKYKRKYTEIKK